MRTIKFLLNKLFHHQQCDGEARNTGKGISGKVYCSLLKHHKGSHVDYSGRRSW